jgi:hypothetical protein
VIPPPSGIARPCFYSGLTRSEPGATLRETSLVFDRFGMALNPVPTVFTERAKVLRLTRMGSHPTAAAFVHDYGGHAEGGLFPIVRSHDHRIRPESRWVCSGFTSVAAVRVDAHPPKADIETVERILLKGERPREPCGQGMSHVVAIRQFVLTR